MCPCNSKSEISRTKIKLHEPSLAVFCPSTSVCKSYEGQPSQPNPTQELAWAEDHEQYVKPLKRLSACEPIQYSIVTNFGLTCIHWTLLRLFRSYWDIVVFHSDRKFNPRTQPKIKQR